MLFLIFTVVFSNVKSQSITNYSFLASAGTFTPLSGADTATLSGGSNDEGYYNALPVGFDFTYMGVAYSSFSASTNGWMTLGQSITSAALTNALSTGGTRPVIAPLWDDNDMASGILSYQTSGTPGNQILTIEWLNVEWKFSVNAPVLSYQVRLYESSGAIEFVYRQEPGTVVTGTASIGITAAGTGAGNYLSLNNSGTTPTVSSTTETTSISIKPANGQTYMFTPPAGPVAPPVSFTASPIGITSMNISFLDNSLNESGFHVYRSLDNINFTLVATIPSTSTISMGTSYSSNQTGLIANTVYYYTIFSFNEAWSSSALNGNDTTLAATFCGTKTVGPTGNYTSLTDAFADIALNGLQCSSILELQATYLCTVETFPVLIPFFGNNNTTTLTIRPEAAATNLLIISDTTQTLNLNGARALIFDGRAGGSGATALTIENTRITGAAISFINGASYNYFHDLVIKGVNNSATSGVVTFLTSTGLTGNNNNTFQNNTISDGATTPNNLVYSAGSVTAPNTGNSVLNNNLFNFFNAASTSAAVLVAGNNSAWTISTNKIYQEVVRTYTTGVQHYGIKINSSTGNNFSVNNNIIGNSSAAGTGIYTLGGSTTRFSAITLTTGTLSPSNIQGNIISNFALTTSSTTSTGEGVFAGIAVLAGSVNIGTTAANFIGSTTVNDVINITSTASLGALVGIYSTSAGIINISNNKIGGFSASGTTAVMGNTIRGINTVGSGSYTISGNEIGSLTIADNIRAGVMGTTTGSTDVSGIENAASGTHTISGNLINNLSSFGTGTGGQIRGISTTSGISSISNNTLSYLTTAAGATGTTSTASVIGISKSGTAADQSVSDNTILNLSNTSVAAAVTINGIYYTGASTGTNLITKNTIQNLSAVTTGLGLINGIYVGGGSSAFTNNMIAIGLDVSGASVSLGNLSFSGIRLATTVANNFYFNSIQVTGSNVTTGTASSQGFIRTSTGITEIKNNIFVNTRSNSTGSGKHYAINLNLTTTVTAGNNDYYFPNGLMGVVATTDYPLLGNWKIGTGLDLSSIKVDPMFISSSDLHINNSTASSLESGGVLIAGTSTDFDADSRPGPIGSINGGGTKPDIGADEFDGIPINLDMGATVLVSPLIAGCYGANENVRVRIKNYAGAEMDFSSNPITVNAEVTGPNPVVFTPVDIYSGTLASGATLDTTIGTNYNMTLSGSYIFKASTILAGDANNANDSMPVVTINVTAGTANASALSICNGRSTTLTLSGYNGSIQWQNSIDGGTVWNNETDTLNTTNTYVVSPVSNIKYRAMVCNLHASNILDVNVLTIADPTTVGATRCGPGPIALSASGIGTLLWYNTSSGGAVVNTGSSYSPSISASTSYYVSDVAGGATERVGKTNAGTSSFISALKYGVLFTVSSPTIIDSVNVYPTGTGTITIQILDPSTQAVLYSAASFSLSGTGTQKIAVPVAISLIPGNYKMSMSYTGITNIVRTTTGGPFPYTSPSGAVSITSGATGTGTSTSYYWFYDWVITSGCESGRTMVTATMTAPPAMNIITTSALICNGDSTTLSVISANPYSYTWSPAGSLNTSTDSSVIAKPTVTTKYYVNAIDTSACLNIDSINITVNVIPSLTLTASPSAVCSGSSAQITGNSFHLLSTLLDENFDVAPTNWIVTNTSTPVGLQWAFVNTYGVSSSLNGTPFALVDSDSPGSGSIVNSTMTCPLVNAAGYDSLVLSFDQYYRHLSSTIATVEVYDGATWVQVYKPLATIGSWITPNIQKINITPYANANLQIRFNYFGNWDYYWAIDNLKISTYIDNNFSWTGSGLSAINISNPVATPSATTMYYVTVTDPSTTCAMNDSIQITVQPNPIINLGMDTTICSNWNLTLDPGANYTTYAWSTAATSQTINVYTAGTYSVMVTDTNGCNNSDSINILVNAAPVISLGLDSTICNGQSVALSPGNYVSYNWSTGEITSTIFAIITDTFTVIVTDTNNCNGYDAVVVTVNDLPVINLGADLSFCENDSAVLDASSGFNAYIWSDNSMLQTLSVTTAGNYSVSVTDTNGCINSDTIGVSVNSLPLVNLGTDKVICKNEAVTLDAGSGFSGYLWNNTATTQTIIVDGNLLAVGNYPYSVIVAESNGCEGTDTVIVTVDLCTGIDEIEDVAVFNIYPNPSQGQFTVASTSAVTNDVTIEVSDLEGRVIYKEHIDELTSKIIKLNNPATGLYFLKIQVASKIIIKKITVN
ncbi:MAG: hypothetical protein A3F72_16530 [Bacteroidetes bacterium RIFCSPLOWO2_12_FULL_35_15]|nr:MAG: hypothetical protein A3F72_16530 [Bacteroidetes bacterium RIFCSPLOWO2_12_FULL_35_15]